LNKVACRIQVFQATHSSSGCTAFPQIDKYYCDATFFSPFDSDTESKKQISENLKPLIFHFTTRARTQCGAFFDKNTDGITRSDSDCVPALEHDAPSQMNRESKPI
jgi:hypothetical protein